MKWVSDDWKWISVQFAALIIFILGIATGAAILIVLDGLLS